MNLRDEEHIGRDDKVLVVVTNQYMLEQILWYHSLYPEGIWYAVVIKFAYDNGDLVNIMYQKCKECDIFKRVVWCDSVISNASFFKKAIIMAKYIFQYITRTREREDKKLIERLTNRECDYKKVIVHSNHSIISVASINAMSDTVIVCLEDGLADYLPATGIKSSSELLNLLLAKLNIINLALHGHCFSMKYDNKIIKYSSLPDKMQYKNYKIVKQLFKEDNRKICFSDEELSIRKANYDVIVFSTKIADFGDYDTKYYNLLKEWLQENYKGKKILFKPHPREKCMFCCDMLDLTIGGKDLAGERLLDLLPEAEIVFTYTSTILLKACRKKRKFKILYFNSVKSNWYQISLRNDSKVLGIKDDDWIILGDK